MINETVAVCVFPRQFGLVTQSRSLPIKRRRWCGDYVWPLTDRGCEGQRADAILVVAGITGWNCDTAGRSSNGQRLLRVPGRGRHQRALPPLAGTRPGKGRGGEGRGSMRTWKGKTAASDGGTRTCMGTGASPGSFTWLGAARERHCFFYMVTYVSQRRVCAHAYMVRVEKVQTFEHFWRFKIGQSQFWKEGKCQASGWLWWVGVSSVLATAATGLHHFPSLDLTEHPPILKFLSLYFFSCCFC